MKKAILFESFLALLLAAGCSEADLNKINPNRVTFDTYFNNAEELTAGVNAVYAITQSASLVNRQWYYTHDLRGDEMTSGGGQLEAAKNQILIGVNDPGNATTGDVWRGWYRTIHRANVVIEKGALVQGIAPALRDRIVGEARFLRAWAYYELASLWGAVPVYTAFVASSDGSAPKSPQADVYKVAIDDLNIAQHVLPASYTGNDLGRATGGAAQTLLARVYLQMGQYELAKTELEKVVNSGQYSLVANYLDLTNEEGEFNAESIFEVMFAPSGGNTNWGSDGDGRNVNEEGLRSQEYSALTWRNVIPSDKLLNSYESVELGDAKTDPRFAMSFWTEGDQFNNGADVLTDNMVQGNTSLVNGVVKKVSWKKYSKMYKSNSTNQNSGINMRIMRYADVLLMLAECENELGNPGNAVDLVNRVRARPSVLMPPLPTANFPVETQAQLRKAIQHERMVELAGEQVRNFDILRWRKYGKLEEEPLSYFIQNRHEFLPIPQQEIDNNPNMGQSDQNPGY